MCIGCQFVLVWFYQFIIMFFLKLLNLIATLEMRKFKMELFKQKMAAYDAWLAAGARGVKHEKPTQPKEVDTLYDAGSTTGLGQLMNETEGRAVWLKHEARKLIKKLAEGGTIGSFDEINHIIEHAYIAIPLLTIIQYFVWTILIWPLCGLCILRTPGCFTVILCSSGFVLF